MSDLNLFLIENKNKIKNTKEVVDKKLFSVKHKLKDCLDYIIEHETIDEQDNEFVRLELLNLLKSYMNINIQLNKKNEKTIIIRDILDNLVDNIVYMSENETNNHNNFEKEIKLIKKERQKACDIINITKSI